MFLDVGYHHIEIASREFSSLLFSHACFTIGLGGNGHINDNIMIDVDAMLQRLTRKETIYDRAMFDSF